MIMAFGQIPKVDTGVLDLAMAFEVHPLTPDRFDDFADVVNPNRRSTHCWCLSHRLPVKEIEALGGGDRERAMRCLTERTNPPGVVGYEDDVPVGWCSIGPREEIPRLAASTSKPTRSIRQGGWTPRWLSWAPGECSSTLASRSPGRPTRWRAGCRGSSCAATCASGPRQPRRHRRRAVASSRERRQDAGQPATMSALRRSHSALISAIEVATKSRNSIDRRSR